MHVNYQIPQQAYLLGHDRFLLVLTPYQIAMLVKGICKSSLKLHRPQERQAICLVCFRVWNSRADFPRKANSCSLGNMDRDFSFDGKIQVMLY